MYLDFGLCKNGYRQDRTLGESAICTDSQSLGRMVIGVYGKAVPQTVQNFITAVQQGERAAACCMLIAALGWQCQWHWSGCCQGGAVLQRPQPDILLTGQLKVLQWSPALMSCSRLSQGLPGRLAQMLACKRGQAARGCESHQTLTR